MTIHLLNGDTNIQRNATAIFVSWGFAISCSFGVWCRWLTLCLLYIFPLFGKPSFWTADIAEYVFRSCCFFYTCIFAHILISTDRPPASWVESPYRCDRLDPQLPEIYVNFKRSSFTIYKRPHGPLSFVVDHHFCPNPVGLFPASANFPKVRGSHLCLSHSALSCRCM